jgi:hypothetical protein
MLLLLQMMLAVCRQAWGWLSVLFFCSQPQIAA